MKINNTEVKGTCHELGTFQMNSDIAIVTDPCYELGTWCQAKISDVLQGTWKAFVFRKIDDWAVGHRSARLLELQKTLEESIELDKQWVKSQPFPRSISFEELHRKTIKEVENWDCARVSVLLAHHDSIDPFVSFDNKWELEKNVGVDSGQMSISSLDSWATEEISLDYEGPTTPNNEYPDLPHRGTNGPYWGVCDINQSSAVGGGIFENRAAVSLAGYGDGSYNSYKLIHEQKVVGIAIVFIKD